MKVPHLNFWPDFCSAYGMTTKKVLPAFLVFILWSVYSHTQELRIKKGVIVDSLVVNDSISESFALYLPRKFQVSGKWPLLAVFDMKGNGKKGISKFKNVADSMGYVVVGSNAIHDSISLSENILRTKRLLDHVLNLLPIHTDRIYAVGEKSGGRFANLVPIFLKDVAGALSIDAALTNAELLNTKNPFQFIAMVERGNFNYPPLLQDERALNAAKFPNAMLVRDSAKVKGTSSLHRALVYFDLMAMARGNRSKDSILIEGFYGKDIANIKGLLSENKYLLANRAMAETLNAFRTLRNTDSLRDAKRELKRTKTYRSLKREQDAAFFKETFLREDFAYYLEEDLLTYNFNNLGWWNYQMQQIDKFRKGLNSMERLMGARLNGYVNALVEDSIELVSGQPIIDEEALVFLYMLKTLTEPTNFDNFLRVTSIASKNEDFGTALFYLEEALKNGFDSKEKLYSIPNTALLRITPEFNALIKKYFEDARYEIKDE